MTKTYVLSTQTRFIIKITRTNMPWHFEPLLALQLRKTVEITSQKPSKQKTMQNGFHEIIKHLKSKQSTDSAGKIRC